MKVEGLQLESSRLFCSFGFGIARFLSRVYRCFFKVVNVVAPLLGTLYTATFGTLRCATFSGLNETKEIFPHGWNLESFWRIAGPRA